MRPVLQKPPGYRDPNMPSPQPPPPPPPVASRPPPPLPMRKTAAGMPTSYRPKRRKRGNFFKSCCCCICVTIVLLIFLFLIATAIFYLWFDPKLPTFSLSSFRLDGFKLTDDDPGGGDSSLSTAAVARVEMRNPNTKLVFYYGDTAVDMSIGSGNDETGMGGAKVEGFRQGPKNSTSVKVETSVKDQVVDRGLAKRLASKFQTRDLVINVVAKTRVGLGVGGMKIGMLAVNLRCGGVSLNKLDTDSPKCILNTLKW
ncbi:hypothetical protein Bca101_041146 [Brassica carinata]